MARSQRDKGKRGELEVVHLAEAVGLTARRTAALQAATFTHLTASDVTVAEFPWLWVEVKRDERMSVDAMVRQAEADAPEGHAAVVVYRRDRQPWRVVEDATEWFRRLALDAARGAGA